MTDGTAPVPFDDPVSASKPAPIQTQKLVNAAAPLLDPADPLAIARQFVAEQYTVALTPTLHCWRNDFRRWRGGAHREVGEAALRAELYAYLEHAERPDKNGKPTPFKPKNHKVSEVMDALRAATFLDEGIDPPAWLEQFPDAPDPAKLLPVANGVLNLDAGNLEPHRPELFVTTALPVSVDPPAPAPAEWLAFLKDLWPDDTEARDALQEIFGYTLTTDTAQQKIFLMVGPRRSGKGTIARVLTGLLGRDNVANPTFASLTSHFGLAPLIDKRLAIISDARLSGRSDQAALAERLLSISGEDGQTIDRKFRDPWNGRLQTRFVIMTNELPRISDSSGAMASRFILLTLTQSFLGKEDLGLTGRLLTELPGIMNWSLVGLRRLRERGHFKQPESSAEAITALEDLASPIGAFVRDCCIVQAGAEVPCDDIFSAWKIWCEDQGRTRPGTRHTFGRDLRAAIPGMKITQHRSDGDRRRYYEGVGVVAP
ncbi:MAG: phage/plasmid primase, P4 family [Alphaproteobacteria bacterium]|nr:phage/plasmid primase, P4 family [Alphaproteobacteria bacterium]